MEWLFYLTLAALLGNVTWYSWSYGITPTPTSPKVKNKLLEILPDLKEGQVLELGSGWGTLAFALAKHFPTCSIQAYEISPLPFFASQGVAYCKSLKNLHFFRQDFFNVTFTEAQLVVCYLYPQAMTRLKQKFKQELPLGAYVVSHTFAIPSWIPLKTWRVNDLYQTPIYLYRMSAALKEEK